MATRKKAKSKLRASKSKAPAKKSASSSAGVSAERRNGDAETTART